jgi:fused signal recognition particle receptor
VGLWQRIKSAALTDVGVLVRGLDRDALARFERVLAEADFGAAAFDLAEELEGRLRRGELKREEQVRAWLAERLQGYLEEAGAEASGELLAGVAAPGVVLLLGVNGAGKTTVAAKLAWRFGQAGKSVLLVAADTWRAAATEQLVAWGRRLEVPVVTARPGADPAAVAFDGIEAAVARGVDVVIVDTAGRLHTQSDLMEELKKVVRVIGRRLPGAPHEALLVLDGTVGQNAVQQGRVFGAALPLTGLVITKLDGTARGGAVLAAVRELRKPVRFIGTGETVGDLARFNARQFVERLLEE